MIPLCYTLLRLLYIIAFLLWIRKNVWNHLVLLAVSPFIDTDVFKWSVPNSFGTPVAYICVMGVACILWLVMRPSISAREHILPSLVSSVFLPSDIPLYHGLVTSSGMFSRFHEEHVMPTWGSLQVYKLTIPTGHWSPASRHVKIKGIV